MIRELKALFPDKEVKAVLSALSNDPDGWAVSCDGILVLPPLAAVIDETSGSTTFVGGNHRLDKRVQ